MEQYVGLDVSLKETVVDQTGTTMWQGKFASTPESIAAVLARRAVGATRIDIESELPSTWYWHALKALGLPVVCLDARHVKAVAATLGGRSAQRHHGVNGVPTLGENSGPGSDIRGRPGGLVQPPAMLLVTYLPDMLLEYTGSVTQRRGGKCVVQKAGHE